MITQRRDIEESRSALIVVGVIVLIGLAVSIIGLATTDSSDGVARVAYGISIVAGLVTGAILTAGVITSTRGTSGDRELDQLYDLVAAAERTADSPPDELERRLPYFERLDMELHRQYRPDEREVTLGVRVALARLSAAVQTLHNRSAAGKSEY
jgi:hypothetical protein